MTDIKMKAMMQSLQKTPYHRWMQSEGLPVIEGHGLEDVRDVELKPWRRTGGKGAFIHLYGMEGITGMYVAEIPPGEALNAGRHMYEEVICVLSGQGATEVWHESGKKQSFEWGAWSLFSPPLNTRHRLVNGGREPVKFLAVTNAPLIMDTFHNLDFVFNSPITFPDRFSGEENYFAMSQKRYVSGMRNLWETNFISDLRRPRSKRTNTKEPGFSSPSSNWPEILSSATSPTGLPRNIRRPTITLRERSSSGCKAQVTFFSGRKNRGFIPTRTATGIKSWNSTGEKQAFTARPAAGFTSILI